MLRFGRVAGHVTPWGVFAHDHAAVDFFARADEELAAVLDHIERVGHGFALLHAYQGTGLAGGDLSAVRAVFEEGVAHHAVAGGHRYEVALEADQSAGGGLGLNGHTGVVVLHIGHLGFALGEVFNHATKLFFEDLDPDLFKGFAAGAVDFFVEDGRAGDENFETFATHRLNEDGDLHGAAGIDQGSGYLRRCLRRKWKYWTGFHE